MQQIQKVDEHVRDLRDEVAKIAFEHINSCVSSSYLSQTSDESVKYRAKLHASRAFDFADAFMRERYERMSVVESLKDVNFNHNGWTTTS